MPRKKSESGQQSSVKIGNMKDIKGSVTVAGRDIITHHAVAGMSAAEIEQLFSQLYAKIEARPATPPAAKEDLKAEVQEIEAKVTEAAETKKTVDEGFLARRFRNIARMAPDMLDVIVATLANPLAGLGVAAKKIADKARAETSSG